MKEKEKLNLNPNPNPNLMMPSLLLPPPLHYMMNSFQQLALCSHSKENILHAVGMMYDHCMKEKTSLDQLQFPCGMNLNFTYCEAYELTPLTMEIEPPENTYTRPLGNVVFPMIGISYTPANKEKCLAYLNRLLR